MDGWMDGGDGLLNGWVHRWMYRWMDDMDSHPCTRKEKGRGDGGGDGGGDRETSRQTYAQKAKRETEALGQKRVKRCREGAGTGRGERQLVTYQGKTNCASPSRTKRWRVTHAHQPNHRKKNALATSSANTTPALNVTPLPPILYRSGWRRLATTP